MLSNIGRAAIKRVGATGSSSSTNRFARNIWRLQRVNALESVKILSTRIQCSSLSQRSYATSTTQTKAPKTKKAATTKAKVKKVTLKKAVKKPAAKKPKKKGATKPKLKPKPKPKKVVTPEQQERADIKALKITALSPPIGKPSTAWLVLVKEFATERAGKSLSAYAKEAAAKYKSLTPQELEVYNHKANQNKAANAIALKQWIESHTPEQIRLANNARLLLKRKTGKPSSYSPLKDSRIPKRPSTGFFHFSGDRWATGDFKGLKISDAAPILHKEYRALSDVDRKVYEDRALADKQRYTQEYKTVFHRDPEFVKKEAAA